MTLFRVAGIRVGISWTWLLALGYLIYTIGTNYQDHILGVDKVTESYLYAVGVSFLFFASIVLHEFGHAFVARRNGIGVLGVDLWLLGGFTKMDREAKTAGVEFRVSAAGPFVTLLIAIACLGTAFALHGDQARHLVRLETQPGDLAWMAALTWLGTVNLFLLVFNLIPAYPLDGGRIARSIAWRLYGDRRRATIVAGQIGRVFGYLVVALGIVMLRATPLSGVIFIFMGMTLASSARAAVAGGGLLEHATNLTVADVMDTQPVVMRSDASVERALDEYFWRYRWPWFPVVDPSGHFMGLIEQHSVEMIDEQDRPARHVADLIASGSDRDRAVLDDTPLTAIYNSPELRDFGALMAVDAQNVLRGVVTTEQVRRALQDAIARATAARQAAQSPPPGA